MTRMTPDQARQYLKAYKADRTSYMPSYAVEALKTIAADTLEYRNEHQHNAEARHVLNEVLHAKAKGRKTIRIDDLLGVTDE